MKIQNKKAFTLVELIIVITILAILATIWFMSFQSYMWDARDANRTTSLQEIWKWLELYQVKNSKLPMPTGFVTITASWTPIWYQWIFWKTESDLIKMTSIPVDPIDNTWYIYSVNESKTKFQLLTYLENQTSYNPNITNQVYAIDYTARKFKTFWDKLGIILNSDSSPISWDVETQTGTTNYNLVFSDTNFYTLSWNLLSVIQAFRWDKSLASLDNTLVWYWDMETLTNSWTQTVLKDLSQYWNNWTCYNSGTAVNCGTSWLWPQFIDGNWTTWKAMSFDGMNDVVWIDDNSIYNFNNVTMYVKVKHSWIQEANNWWWWRIISQQSWDYIFIRIDDSFARDWITPNNRWNLNSWFKWGWIVSWWSFTWTNLITSNFENIIIKKDTFISGFVNWLKIWEMSNITWFINPPSKLLIWWLWYTAENFSWQIDEIKIYNTALSDNAIKAIYDASK